MVKNITILDFQEGKVYVRKVPETMLNDDAYDIASHFESELKLPLDDCQWMISEREDFLNIDDNTVKLTVSGGNRLSRRSSRRHHRSTQG